MKAIKFIIIISLLMGISGCKPKIDLPIEEAKSEVTFLKNTLNYPILVQSFYRPFDNDLTLWCEKEPVAWDEPILIQPNEYQLIMDYVVPDRIKIFNTDTTLIIDVQYGVFGYVDMGKIFISSASEAEKMGVTLEKGYYLQAERYLADNVPFEQYPIYFDQFNCSEELVTTTSNETRKERYKNQTDGYALIRFLEINTEAECFAQQ